MAIDTYTLLWLFPIAFMFHDFEEIILGELWLKKHGSEIKARIKKRVPDFLASQMSAALDKSTAELALPISLIFSLTFLATFLATVYGQYGFFLLASSVFFLHGFMHLGQAILLRRYVPAVLTSVVIAIPYGLILYGRLLGEGTISLTELLVNFLIAIVLTIPFILVMHRVGDYLFKGISRLLLS